MQNSEILRAWLAHASAVKFSALLLILIALLIAERLRPHRPAASLTRRANNLLLSAIASASVAALLWALPALGAAAVALFAAQQNIGLLNLILPGAHQTGLLPNILSVLISLVVLDLTIYWQHRLSHLVPWLWRLHRVHHSDLAFDVTLGLRFHPGEIVLSLLYKSTVVLLLGAPIVAVLIYELLLMAMALFTHANIALPNRLERAVGTALITPELHRVHHSTDEIESNRNFGNWLSIWDRIFNSAASRRADSASMPIGLMEFRAVEEQTLGAILMNPLLGKSDDS